VVGPGSPKISNIPRDIPLVLDSAAISFVDAKRNPITVLTPHEGELKYLGYSLDNRLETAQRISNDLNAILVLKGSRTIVAAPHLTPLLDDIGGPELSTAGSGDILAGLIGSMLASWKPKNISEAQIIVFKAIQMHSMAGRLARRRINPVVATDILQALGEVNL
jgi:NAD(P)H-hydrate repair Nnr-like enzyme with NAD(P)H-hydrate dehydratase domain